MKSELRHEILNLTGKAVAENIEDTGAGISISKPAIPFMQLLYIRTALKLPKGMKLSRSLPSGTTMARKYLGFKGNKESLLQQVEEMIARIQAERREEEQA